VARYIDTTAGGRLTRSELVRRAGVTIVGATALGRPAPAARAACTPLLITPPFPEYTSGHSVQSGAAAEVLTALFGRIAFIDRTHETRGLPPRSFRSFEEAAREAALSRLYGGIHFRAAIDRGLEQGACIGRQVAALT
jgi:hypothetical protein